MLATTPGQPDKFKSRKEQLQKLAPTEVIPDNPLDETVLVDVVTPPPRPQPSLKDKVLGSLKQSGEQAKTKPKPVIDKKQTEKSLQFFKQVLPLTLAAMLATYSQRLFKDPYKPCAPTKQEVSDILLPTFNLISRYVEVTGAASQNALDIGAALLATFTMGARMLLTLTEIKQYEQQKTHSSRQPTPDTNPSQLGADPRRNSNKPSQGTVEHSASNGASTGDRDDTLGGIDDRTFEAAKVAELLKRDTAGRRQMGLAPRLLRTEDE